MHRKALGRGLEALIPAATAIATLEGKPAGTLEIPLGEISPNPFQPRKRFEDESIRELADSIKATGVLQPVLVRRTSAGGYELVVGERRLRAAGLAGLPRIPAIIRDIGDREMMELALIENIQRENLNPIEEAQGYLALIDKVGLTHEQLSERVGKQRSSISNTLRLLALPTEAQELVSRGTLSAGHARALLGLERQGDILAAARYVSSKGFSVRRTEAFVRRRLRRQHTRPRAAASTPVQEFAVKLQQKFGTHVSIVMGRKGGFVRFEFYGQEDLERLLEHWNVM